MTGLLLFASIYIVKRYIIQIDPISFTRSSLNVVLPVALGLLFNAVWMSDRSRCSVNRSYQKHVKNIAGLLIYPAQPARALDRDLLSSSSLFPGVRYVNPSTVYYNDCLGLQRKNQWIIQDTI